VHAIKTYSIGRVQVCLILRTRGKWVVTFTSWQLYPRRKNPWHPPSKRKDGPERFWRRKTLSLPPGIKPPFIVPTVTELSGLPDVICANKIAPQWASSSEAANHKYGGFWLKFWESIIYRTTYGYGERYLRAVQLIQQIVSIMALTFIATSQIRGSYIYWD